MAAEGWLAMRAAAEAETLTSVGMGKDMNAAARGSGTATDGMGGRGGFKVGGRKRRLGDRGRGTGGRYVSKVTCPSTEHRVSSRRRRTGGWAGGWQQPPVGMMEMQVAFRLVLEEQSVDSQQSGRAPPTPDTCATKDTWHNLNESPDPFFPIPNNHIRILPSVSSTQTFNTYRTVCSNTTSSPLPPQKPSPSAFRPASSDGDPVRPVLRDSRTCLVTRPRG